MSADFPCTRCGACCKSVHLSPATAWLGGADGVCRHLDEHSLTCTIYERRPDVCNVKVMFKRHYESTVTWTAFVVANQRACVELVAQQDALRVIESIQDVDCEETGSS
jgi:Fe-S-cluster containining protein